MLLNQASSCSNNLEQKEIMQKFLDLKRTLAKGELDQIKEKIELKKCREIIDGERPVKCFFQRFKKTDLKGKKLNNLYDNDGRLRDRLSDMLSIASDFYSNLYQSADICDDNLLNYFLSRIELINIDEDCDIEYMLCRDFTLEEIWDAIVSFMIGKSPGPDGLSIEFYKTNFSIIKYDLLAFFNKIKNSEFVPSKIKAGLITLIPKGDNASPDIANYRGITLNNVDLKIYTKMLHFRLTPFLENYIHSSQFANKGKKIWELNCVLRDIFNEMNADSGNDSFMVRIDFRKAFDCINMNFLYKVMEKMGLPIKFINIIKSIDSNLSAKIVINGGKSKRVKIKRGTRQGDPLSMDKFIIALNPLILALNDDNLIQKYLSRSNKEFLTLANADDLTLVTNSLSSVLRIKFMVDRFSQVSGLQINMDKTVGFFFNKRGLINISDLPFNHWNQNSIILGIPYGSEEFVGNFWVDKFNAFKEEVSYFKSFHYLTMQAKAIISKSKLLPKISYLASTLVIPATIMAKIDNELLRFVVPHGKTFLTVENLAANKDMGGINYAHIVLHSSIMFLRNVLNYVKLRKDNLCINDYDYFIEFNIGQQLSSLFHFVADNRISHAAPLNSVYQYTLDVLKMFKQIGVTDEDLLSCKVNVIYHKSVRKIE